MVLVLVLLLLLLVLLLVLVLVLVLLLLVEEVGAVVWPTEFDTGCGFWSLLFSRKSTSPFGPAGAFYFLNL